MGKKTITVLDSVHSKVNAEAREAILKYLKYESTYMKQVWVKNQKGKAYPRREKQTKTSHLITGRIGSSGLLLTGLLPKVTRKEDIEIIGAPEKLIPTSKKPKLKGIKFRKDQLTALRKMKKKQRGVIVFPTGSGKTIIALGFMSMFIGYRILFLCHTKELIRQTSDELNKFNMDHYLLGDNNKVNWESISKLDSCILISTIQSFKKAPSEIKRLFFDIVIVDEVHNASSEKTDYGKLMLQCLSPVKIGLTATLPTKNYEKLVVEGFFGPIIYELTNEKGEEAGIIAKAKVNMLPVPFQTKLCEKTRPTYKEIYDLGIVKNKKRNQMIVEEAKKTKNKNKSVLIVVEKIEHGLILQKMLGCPFVQGKSESEFKSIIKEQMKKEKEKIAICTRVWKEGINIPPLNHVIYAPGMKEEKAIRQAMGRGLRTTEKKKKIKLTDFLDPYPYLAQHSIIRYSIYHKLGWIK